MSTAQAEPIAMPELVTIEDVKSLVRRYCDQEYPGVWCSASVGVLVGEPTQGEELERLLILRAVRRPALGS